MGPVCLSALGAWRDSRNYSVSVPSPFWAAKNADLNPSAAASTKHPMAGWIGNWLERHRRPANRGLHAVGIPLLAAGLILALVQLIQWRWDLWWRPVGLIALSYLLQWWGHRVEGNDLGEMVLLKRLLGRPYVAVAPPRPEEVP